MSKVDLKMKFRNPNLLGKTRWIGQGAKISVLFHLSKMNEIFFQVAYPFSTRINALSSSPPNQREREKNLKQTGVPQSKATGVIKRERNALASLKWVSTFYILIFVGF